MVVISSSDTLLIVGILSKEYGRLHRSIIEEAMEGMHTLRDGESKRGEGSTHISYRCNFSDGTAN